MSNFSNLYGSSGFDTSERPYRALSCILFENGVGGREKGKMIRVQLMTLLGLKKERRDSIHLSL